MNEDKARVVSRLIGDYYFSVGNIVKWGKGLWIVSKVQTNQENKVEAIELIDLNNTNTTARPSLTWPEGGRGLKEVKIVSSCMKDLFKSRIEKLFCGAIE